MNTLIKSTAILSALISTLSATSRPDGHAPIGVMGDHTHSAGGWMSTARFMSMKMNDIYRGTDTVDANMMGTGYMMSPIDMTMNMTMLGFMYAPNNKLTLTAMTNHIDSSMSMANGAGVKVMEMNAQGMGDTSLGGLFQIFKTKESNAHIGLSVSLPTGDTDLKVKSSPMPAMIGKDIPYCMQLGSGTIDLNPSFTYNHFMDTNWSWGSQAKATLRTGRNEQGYSLGDSLNLSGWLSRSINHNISLNTRLDLSTWGGIDGSQKNGIHSPMKPSSAADPANSGGKKADLYVGANYITDQGYRLAAEAGKTLYQNLDGTQLGSDWNFQLGAQVAW